MSKVTIKKVGSSLNKR